MHLKNAKPDPTHLKTANLNPDPHFLKSYLWENASPDPTFERVIPVLPDKKTQIRVRLEPDPPHYFSPRGKDPVGSIDLWPAGSNFMPTYHKYIFFFISNQGRIQSLSSRFQGYILCKILWSGVGELRTGAINEPRGKKWRKGGKGRIRQKGEESRNPPKFPSLYVYCPWINNGPMVV